MLQIISKHKLYFIKASNVNYIKVVDIMKRNIVLQFLILFISTSLSPYQCLEIKVKIKNLYIIHNLKKRLYTNKKQYVIPY